ncbi:MAG TPA: hypothetical protein VFE17_04230 [Candidatus Baltobacteraceae bacterium]|jgi:hypothetical protein|nr:hypothetical protein [Candidatus Baltobacteraceae bacterium]
MLVAVDRPTALRLLRIYGINPPMQDDRFEKPARFDAGIPVTIEAVGGSDGPAVRLKIDGQRFSYPCPLDASAASHAVQHLHEEHVLPQTTASDAALHSLLVKASRMYVETGMGAVHLILYLTPQGYRMHAVYMTRSKN